MQDPIRRVLQHTKFHVYWAAEAISVVSVEHRQRVAALAEIMDVFYILRDFPSRK